MGIYTFIPLYPNLSPNPPATRTNPVCLSYFSPIV